jgi:hypothetical protein
MIDMASVYADRFKQNPQALQAAVMGQSPDPKLDPYTALNALRLIKESQQMAMAGQAQQPTSAPSIVAQNMAPNPMMQGLGAMVPGAMGQGPQNMPPQGMPPQGMPPQGMPPQAPPMQAASGGLAGMYTPEEDYAAGGIVAFQSGGLNAVAATDDATRRISSGDDGDDTGQNNPTFLSSTGDPRTYSALAEQLPGAIQDISEFEFKGMSPKEYEQVQADEIAAYRRAMGPNTAMESLAADIAERKKERTGNLEEGKGVALLKAAAAMAQGNNWVRAFGNAGAAFGDEYNRALQADKAEKRSIAVAEFNMADAQRKENIGLFKEGRAAADRAMAAKQAAEKARLDKTKAVADALTKGMTVTRPLNRVGGAGAGGPKLPQVDRDAAAITKQIIALEAKNPDDPQIAILKKQRAGLVEILGMGKEGPTAAPRAAATLTAKQNASVAKDMAVWEGGGEARKAKMDGTIDAVRAAKKEALRQDALRGVFDDGDEAPSVITPKPKNTGKMPPPPAGFNRD